jgi:hypothetical protein
MLVEKSLTSWQNLGSPMKWISTLLLLLWIGIGSVGAQNPTSHLVKVPRSGTVNVQSIKVDYRPLLTRMEAPYPDGNSEKARIARQKDALLAGRHEAGTEAQKVDSTAPSPWMSTNFQTNQVIQGVPNDNDMAVSDDGKIVSVINSNIYMHDATGAALANISLDAWCNSLGVTGDKFDPRTLYDPIHDRFVIVCLNGFTDSTSYVIVGFSQTNDPAAAWNLYALPGDPNGDSLWTDYPIIALTEDELFLTVNLLYNDQPWQTGFNRSIVWQMDLDSAYLGGTLQTRLWDSINFGNAPIRNLCPMQGGSTPMGPNMYFLSNRNFATGNDTVFILEITDTMNAPGVALSIGYGITDRQYAMAPNAMQQFNQQLATNDGRWLDGFLENGNLQFVGNCLDTATGRAGFYHGTVTDVAGARTVTGKVIGYPNGDYGYPAIGWMGMSPTDNDALIAINYTGTTAAQRAGCGAIFSDGFGNYSPMVVAHVGMNYISTGGVNRWGDYTGIQRRYNAQGEVWMAGTFGKSNRLPGTWIAEFHHPAIVAVEPVEASTFDPVAFPNPTSDMMFLEFSLDTDRFLDISICNVDGQVVKTLRRDLVRAGKNRISYSTQPLSQGTYFLRITDGERLIATERIVKVQ